MRLLCPCLSGERGEGGHWTRRKNDISKKDTEKGPVLEAGSSGFPSRTKVQGQAATPRALGPQMMVMGRLEMLHCPGWGGGEAALAVTWGLQNIAKWFCKVHTLRWWVSEPGTPPGPSSSWGWGWGGEA